MRESIGHGNDPIDRIAPTLRPDGRAVMRQKWRDLLFLHWEIPAAQLRPLIPAALDVDTYEGRAYVGLVPFTMMGVRPVWSPSIPLLSNFHETNVRTYVHLRGADPGVWFFSLDAANAIAVRIARRLFRLPYFYARMDLKHGTDCRAVRKIEVSGAGSSENGPRIAYSSCRLWPEPVPAGCSVEYAATGTAGFAVPGTLDHFLIERYILYTGDETALYSGRVHHGAYPVRGAELHAVRENMIVAAGMVRGDGPPLTHYSSGVDVDVFGLRKVRL